MKNRILKQSEKVLKLAYQSYLNSPYDSVEINFSRKFKREDWKEIEPILVKWIKIESLSYGNKNCIERPIFSNFMDKFCYHFKNDFEKNEDGKIVGINVNGTTYDKLTKECHSVSFLTKGFTDIGELKLKELEVKYKILDKTWFKLSQVIFVIITALWSGYVGYNQFSKSSQSVVTQRSIK